MTENNSMFTIDRLFLVFSKGEAFREDPVTLSASIYYTLYYYRPLISTIFARELNRVMESLPHSAKVEGALNVLIFTGNFNFLPEVTLDVIRTLLSRFHPEYLYKALTSKGINCSSASHLFYKKGLKSIPFLSEIRNIENVVNHCDFDYTAEMDLFLPTECIIEIARCSLLCGKKITYMGPNYLGLVPIGLLLGSTVQNGDTFFDTSLDFRYGVNVQQIKSLASCYKNNISQRYYAKIESLEKGKECSIITVREALHGILRDQVIDFYGDGKYSDFHALVSLYGEDVVPLFTNYKAANLIPILKGFSTRPDFCANWKPNDLCPEFYRYYYDKEISWDSKCVEKAPCYYCNREEYDAEAAIRNENSEHADYIFNKH